MLTLLAIFAALYALFAVLDFVAPARKLTPVRLWRLRGILAFFLYLAISVAGPMFWDAVIAEHTLFDASQLPDLGANHRGLFVARTRCLCLAQDDACCRTAVAASAPDAS